MNPHSVAPYPSKSRHKVLIVDDEVDICALFSRKLIDSGFDTDMAHTLDEALLLAGNYPYHAILLDLFLDDENSLDRLWEFFERSPGTKIVILTGKGSIDFAVNAMNKGASGFLVKTDFPDTNIERFKDLIRKPVAAANEFPDLTTFGIIGKSKPIRNLASNLQKLQEVDSTVLMQGESGTGKEMFARAIHKMSNRSKGQFIAINCAAISENILESELFGYKRGAFTDAKQDRKGYFETCSEGTLFLDEIGEMSPQMQSKLLRVLQEKEVTPLGSCKPIPINTRILAATNRDLHRDMHSKSFREDLFYRLAVFQIDLPPLRERRDDIPLLISHFVEHFNRRFNKSIKEPPPSVYTRLQAYNWPGNVRELQNAVERAVVLARNSKLSAEDLLPYQTQMKETCQYESPRLVDLPLNFQQAKETFEKFFIENLLHVTEGNIAEAARVSGQYRPNVYRLINKFHIDPQNYKYREPGY